MESKVGNQRAFCHSSRKRRNRWNMKPLAYYWFFTCIFLYTMTVVYGHNYTWIENDDRLDCVVGIVLNDKPVATGVWITLWSVLTARNPFNAIPSKGTYVYNIKIYSIAGYYSQREFNYVNCYRDAVCGYYRNDSWVRHGFKHKHSPLHDLMIFTADMPSAGWKRFPARHYLKADNRYGYMAILPSPDEVLTNNELMFAGFGYIDKKHVEDNVLLEMDVFWESVIEDCDEWIPRGWGRFICISNVRNFYGIGAGMPLFNKGLLFGIGSFTLHKNNQSIFVFTDVRPYLPDADLCYCWSEGYVHTLHVTENQREWLPFRFMNSARWKLLPNFSFIDPYLWRWKRKRAHLPVWEVPGDDSNPYSTIYVVNLKEEHYYKPWDYSKW